MEVVRPRFRPDASLSRDEMIQLQHDIATAAVFADGIDADTDAGTGTGTGAIGRTDGPPVGGVDQGFDGEVAVSAAVAVRGDRERQRVTARRPAPVPYVPGLLSFREGAAVLAALTDLDADPAVTLVDGSGRIHFREAGLATHVGVALDVPTIGVAKNLLCGRPRSSTDGLAVGDRVPIEADGDVSAPDGTVIGHAVQTRTFDSPNRHVNPVYVSPGHRVSASTAADVVLACTHGYKLPEPTRLADAAAEAAT